MRQRLCQSSEDGSARLLRRVGVLFQFGCDLGDPAGVIRVIDGVREDGDCSRLGITEDNGHEGGEPALVANVDSFEESGQRGGEVVQDRAHGAAVGTIQGQDEGSRVGADVGHYSSSGAHSLIVAVGENGNGGLTHFTECSTEIGRTLADTEGSTGISAVLAEDGLAVESEEVGRAYTNSLVESTSILTRTGIRLAEAEHRDDSLVGVAVVVHS